MGHGEDGVELRDLTASPCHRNLYISNRKKYIGFYTGIKILAVVINQCKGRLQRSMFVLLLSPVKIL